MLRRARPLGRRPGRDPGAHRGPAARRGADLRARPRGADRAKRRAAPLHRRRRRGDRRRRLRLHRGRHAAHLLGRRRSLRGVDGDRRAAGDRPALRRRDEEHGSGRHGPQGAPPPRRARAAPGRVRLESRVHGRGNRGQGLPPSRPDRRRRVQRRGRRRRRRPARGHRGSGRPLRRRVGGDDQAGGERGADDADLVHQRDRERLRGDRRRRRARRRGDRPRPADRPELPARGDRLRRLLFPEGLAGAEAAGSELGLPLPAAQRRDRGERAAEAPRDRQAPQPPRLAAEQADRAARARVQAAHRRHAGGTEPRPRGQAAGRGGRRDRVGSGRRRTRPARRRDRRHAGGGGSSMPTPS